jgi:hypothetical protein
MNDHSLSHTKERPIPATFGSSSMIASMYGRRNMPPEKWKRVPGYDSQSRFELRRISALLDRGVPVGRGRGRTPRTRPGFIEDLKNWQGQMAALRRLPGQMLRTKLRTGRFTVPPVHSDSTRFTVKIAQCLRSPESTTENKPQIPTHLQASRLGHVRRTLVNSCSGLLV